MPATDCRLGIDVGDIVAFVDALQRDAIDGVTVELVDAHVNSSEFVTVAVGRLLSLLESPGNPVTRVAQQLI